MLFKAITDFFGVCGYAEQKLFLLCSGQFQKRLFDSSCPM